MTYTYHDHPSHPGYGWIEPIMDADCPLIEARIAEEIAGLLNGRSASATPAVEQAQQDTSNYVSCGCGDMYLPDSYGAGYIHGAGQCENCEAGQPHAQTIRDAALEDAALSAETYPNPYGHDAASAHACDMTAVAIGKGIRALKFKPMQQDGERVDADIDIDAAAKTLAACMDYPWAAMPEQGRAEMRKHAQAVIDAARAKEQP